MSTRETLIAAALKVLEEEGEATFSTRAVLAVAQVSAPTLYHHFGNADGILSAALEEAFVQFLASKERVVQSSNDAIVTLRTGWDDYVRFAASRPRLYAAMLSRVLQGGNIAAAQQAFQHLINQLEAIEVEGRLAVDVQKAADRMWASANAASLLYVTARQRGVPLPDEAVLAELRDTAIEFILAQN